MTKNLKITLVVEIQVIVLMVILPVIVILLISMVLEILSVHTEDAQIILLRVAILIVVLRIQENV